MYKIIFAICLVFFACSCATHVKPISDNGNLCIEVEQQERTYSLYIPADLPKNAPLLFVLHGYGSTNMDMMNNLGINELADQYGFIVCYPQGLKDKNGNTHWNDGLAPSKVKDIVFLSELAIELQKKYGIDSQRVWTSGFSNGAFMSYKLISYRPDIFRAAASVAGIMSLESWLHRPSSGNPIPVLQIHGMNDEVVAHDASIGPFGNTNKLGPGLDTVMQYWSEYNSCVRYEDAPLSEDATLRTFYTKEGDSPVQYVMIEDYGHSWPSSSWDTSGINASEIIVNFFYEL